MDAVLDRGKDVHSRLIECLEHGDIIGATALYCHYSIESSSKRAEDVLTDSDITIFLNEVHKTKDYTNTFHTYTSLFTLWRECNYIVGVALTQYEMALLDVAHIAAQYITSQLLLKSEQNKKRPSKTKIEAINHSIENINIHTNTAVEYAMKMQVQYVSIVKGLWDRMTRLWRADEFVPCVLWDEMYGYASHEDVIMERVLARVSNVPEIEKYFKQLVKPLPPIDKVKAREGYIRTLNEKIDFYGMQPIKIPK